MLREELQDKNIGYMIEFGGKHPKLKVGDKMFTMPKTPGEYRSVMNLRSEIRRHLRGEG